MNLFISALQFMTILPVGKIENLEIKKMHQYFPLVGIFLGVIVSIFDQIALMLWPQQIASLLDVVLLIILTGAFHVDGLGDTADGLLGIRTKDQALLIMKDSRLGTMALATIFSVLLIKWCGIMGIGSNRILLLIIIPAYARGAILFGIYYFEYGREEGTGKAHFANPLKLTDFWGLSIPFALSFFIGFKMILLNLAFIILVVIIIMFYKKRIGCITGDMLGAMTEIVEAFLFLIISMGCCI